MRRFGLKTIMLNWRADLGVATLKVNADSLTQDLCLCLLFGIKAQQLLARVGKDALAEQSSPEWALPRTEQEFVASAKDSEKGLIKSIMKCRPSSRPSTKYYGE